MFMAAWRLIMPNRQLWNHPRLHCPSCTPRPTAPSPHSIPSKLTVNLLSPYSSLFYNRQVDKVLYLPRQGRWNPPGTLIFNIRTKTHVCFSIHEEHKATKYFISSGFAFVHSSSITDIITIEAVPIEQIDPS